MLRFRSHFVAAGLFTLGAVLYGAVNWHAFTVALAKTDAAETWAETRANVSKSAHYLLSSTPRVAAQQPDQPAASAEQAARQAVLAPFSGGWGKHGYQLSISPDGSGEATWRTYEWCHRPGVKPPCDSIAPDGIIQEGGHAVLTFSSVEGRTAYGSMIDISDPAHLVRLSVSLTLQPEGTALMRSGDEARVRTAPGGPTDGRTLCGTLEAWQTGVCGA